MVKSKSRSISSRQWSLVLARLSQKGSLVTTTSDLENEELEEASLLFSSPPTPSYTAVDDISLLKRSF